MYESGGGIVTNNSRNGALRARPVMVLEGCELLAWHARFRGLDGLR